MHKGAFIGRNVENQQKRILILGESHHTDKGENSIPGIAATYDTEEIVRDRYLKSYNCSTGDRDPAYHFFDKIVCSFGVDPEKGRTDFWESVCFGNYIDVLCGVGDHTAANLLKAPCNRQIYNDQLFQFVAENEIDVIFCFSRRVYNKLPGLASGEKKEEIINAGDLLRTKDGKPKKDYISYCEYLPGSHNYAGKPLKRTVAVYGMLHPSGRYGFRPENYAPTLSKLIRF